MSAVEFVKAHLKANPKASNEEITAAGKKKGITIAGLALYYGRGGKRSWKSTGHPPKDGKPRAPRAPKSDPVTRLAVMLRSLHRDRLGLGKKLARIAEIARA